MFAITGHKGFQMTFANGCTVSVQFGPGNYCEHHGRIGDFMKPAHSGSWESKQAEVAAWGPDRRWHDFGCDEVKGYMSADEVMDFMAQVQKNGVVPSVKV